MSTDYQPTVLDRIRDRSTSGADFYPRLKKEPTAAAWEAIFAGDLSKVPDRCRTLAEKPFAEIIREACFWDGGGVRLPAVMPEDVIRDFAMSMRAEVSGGNAVAGFRNMINTSVFEGYAELADSLDAVPATRELTCFLPAPIVQAVDAHNLKPLARGGAAAHTSIEVADWGEWRLTRFARQAIIDEQTLVNDVPGTLRQNLEQMGRAAQRCWQDAQWSLILANPVLDQDGTALFHADHGNIGTAVLSDTAIGTACAAIRKQIVVAEEADGGDQNQFINIKPRFLVIPPELEVTARKALRLMKLDDPSIDLQLRIEARMSDIGVRNPFTGATVKGTATNWMVTADSTVAPWLLKGVLQGQTGPKVRMGPLEVADHPGQWGVAVDVVYNFAVKAADFRGVYFSSGSGA